MPYRILTLKGKSMMTKKLTALLLPILALSACGGHSSGGTSAPQTPAPENQKKNSPLQIKDLTESKFYAKAPLSFANAEKKNYTLYAQTSMATNVTRYSLFFNQQNQINSQQIAKLDSYCELYVDASQNTKASDVEFPLYQKFLVSQVSQSSSITKYFFELSLQAGMFNNMQVLCYNTPDSNAFLKHVGHILSMTPPTTSNSGVPNGVIPLEIYQDNGQIRLGVFYTTESKKTLNFTFTLWAPSMAPKMKISSLSWRLFNAKTQKPIGSWNTEIKNSNTTYPGAMAFVWDVTDPSVIDEAIKSLGNLQILLSVNRDDTSASHTIDLGQYCISNPEKFINVTQHKTGCGK